MDLDDFWQGPNERRGASVAAVEKAERTVGYKLPRSYVEVLRRQNGGQPRRNFFPLDQATRDGVPVREIHGLGGTWGIDSTEHGTRFWIEEWGYPEIGIVIGDCGSAGHDAVMLDYSQCGPRGEPRVVHVDVEVRGEPLVTLLAEDFDTFVRGLTVRDQSSDREAELATDERRVRAGHLGPLLRDLCAKTVDLPDVEQILRAVAARKLEEFGAFAFHDDPTSYLMYDLLFHLYTNVCAVESAEAYLEVYPKMVAFPDGDDAGFSTEGYGPSFVADWLRVRLAERVIAARGTKGLRFTDTFVAALVARATQVLAE